jgi:hypothetical protein
VSTERSFFRDGSSPSKNLGKEARDEYNRKMGRVAGFYNYLPDSDSSVKREQGFFVLVQTSKGFENVDSARILNVTDEYLVIRSEVKHRLTETKEKILWLVERIKALEISDAQDHVGPDASVLMAAHIQHKSRFNELMNGIKDLLESAQARIEELHSEIDVLERGLVDLSISKKLGEIGEKSFEEWSNILNEGLNSALLELSDLDDDVKELRAIERQYRDVFRVEILTGQQDGNSP